MSHVLGHHHSQSILPAELTQRGSTRPGRCNTCLTFRAEYAYVRGVMIHAMLPAAAECVRRRRSFLILLIFACKRSASRVQGFGVAYRDHSCVL